MAREFPLNPGEAVLTRQVPHPVAALALYFFSLAALLWSLAVHFIFSSPYWDEAQPMVGGGPETGMVMAAWILPIVIALILVNLREDNRGTAFLFLFLTGPVLALLLWDTAVLGEDPDSGFYSGFVSSYGILAGLLSLVAVDFYRRSVRYYFTSQRMILSRKFLAHGYLGIPYLELKGLRVSYNWLGGLFEVGDLVFTVEEDRGKKLARSAFFRPGLVKGLSRPEQLLKQLAVDFEVREPED